MCPLSDHAAEPVQRRASIFAAFGLALEVDPGIAIPGLKTAETLRDSDNALAPTQSLTRIRLDPPGLERRWAPWRASARRMRELHQGGSVVLSVDLAEPAGYLLQAEGVGRILITPDGTELLCDPLPECSDWAFILPAQALPLAATLQGREVFHASAVVVEGSATLFAGDAGAGKSSLAAAFIRRGAPLLGDDAISLERSHGSLVAHPSVGALYLRPPEHDRLSDAERSALGSPSQFIGKQCYEPETTGGPVPFGMLFMLERGEVGPAVEHMEEVEPFALLAATFNLSVRTPERLTRQLDVVEDLIATRQIYRLRVLPGMDATQLANIVEGHRKTVSA